MASQVLCGRYMYGSGASTRAGNETSMDALPADKSPDWAAKLKGYPPSVTLMPTSIRSVGLLDVD